MDFGEPEHIGMLRESIRRMLDKHASREQMAKWDEEDKVPRALMEHIRDLGICGMTVPESFGGTGRDVLGTMVAVEELSRRSMVIATLYLMNSCYGSMNILASGSEEQKQRLLPQLADGQLLFAYGLSEPDVGSDLASVRTRAERRGDKVIINGTKRWCSGAEIADYIYALVRSGEPDARYKNLSLVLIPPTAKGVELTHIPAMGARGLNTNDVSLVDVEISIDDVIGGEDGWNNGWTRLAGPALEVEKLEVAAMALGIAAQAVDDAWEYSQQRKQFGSRICSVQSIRHMLADVQTKLAAARLMLYRGCWLADNNLPCSAETSMAKMYVCELGLDIVLTCQKVMGAYGYAKGFDMERYVRDMLLMPIIGGSTAIQKNNIANRMGLPKS
ncbi:acyl-CoA dehydrogenase family protein [Hoeflea sp. EC-HK425]|uniref:acyl-CoA dehydrogenase family protein n=1 Tax=Hoeflea sp. EC-HK425 TaxID=2038388 RepID=UPI0012562E49|nr:acyl-CoA dehydrogenase family protein [Hoeflea sp. EC-HK425]VVT01102.1 Acyl-CoA dehydrogenase [Hoeflea sp. EC-HK425]